MAGNDDSSIQEASFINATYTTMNDSVADGSLSAAHTEEELREQVR